MLHRWGLKENQPDSFVSPSVEGKFPNTIEAPLGTAIKGPKDAGRVSKFGSYGASNRRPANSWWRKSWSCKNTIRSQDIERCPITNGGELHGKVRRSRKEKEKEYKTMDGSPHQASSPRMLHQHSKSQATTGRRCPTSSTLLPCSPLRLLQPHQLRQPRIR